MKVTLMPSVHAANLVENSGNTAYGVDVIRGNMYDHMTTALILLTPTIPI